MKSHRFMPPSSVAGTLPSRRAVRRTCRAAVAIAAFGALTLVVGCGDDEGEQAGGAPPPAVTVAPVTAKDVNTSASYVGRTLASHSVDIRARVSGYLLERMFEEGRTVTAHQQLFQIDPVEYEAARKADAAEVERIQAALTEAERNLKRSRELAKRGNISQTNVDKAIADEAQARAALAAAKAGLERAEINLSYTIIESPIAGRAGAASVDTGNLIGPDSGVLTTIVDTDPIRVEFGISERELLNYLNRKQAGTSQTYTPRLKLANGEMFGAPGAIDFIDNRVDPRTGTIKVRAEFPNPDGLVTAGQFVSVVITGSESRKGLVVPQAAVQANQTGSFVLVVDGDNKVEARPVSLGARLGAEIVVTAGLQEGETIVVEGLQKARPGGTVTPVQAGSATPAASGS